MPSKDFVFASLLNGPEEIQPKEYQKPFKQSEFFKPVKNDQISTESLIPIELENQFNEGFIEILKGFNLIEEIKEITKDGEQVLKLYQILNEHSYSKK